jgi:hypothetical protein
VGISGRGCLLLGAALALIALVPIAVVIFVIFFYKPAPRPATPAEVEFRAAVAKLDPLPVQAWQPDPTLLEKLAPEVELRTVIKEMVRRKAEKSGLGGVDGDFEPEIANYALRLPADLRLLDDFSQASRPTNLNWEGPKHADGTRPALMVSITAYVPGQTLPSAAELLAQRVPVTGGTDASRQLKLKNVDRGKLGDLVWVRGHWTYESGGLQGEALKYGAVNEARRESILIEAQDCLPWSETTLPLLETSIQTFHEKH